MKILLCIDDTDNLDSIGTGEVLQNLCEELASKGLGEGGFISRHQLFVHEDIPYTSHNSSMCCQMELEDERFAAFLDFCRRYLAENCAEGSDPGLCIVLHEAIAADEKDQLIRFGRNAKVRIFTKEEAYKIASCFPAKVFLSEHGGTGQGIIGALAGCGLRLYGNDGRMKGKIYPQEPKESQTVGELCAKYEFACAMTLDGQLIDANDTVVPGEEIKAVLLNHHPAIILSPDKETGKWHPVDKKQLKKY